MPEKSPDERYMGRALELAAGVLGRTSPNPVVGAVLINQAGELVSEGFHEGSGKDHAEIVALKGARDRAKDSILYVNLEPCCHYGKTPPCCEAIINAGIRKVVIGTIDPNPKVNGLGVKRLREAGIEVITGVLEKECLELNKFFFKWVKEKLPWVSLKVACSLNGYMSSNDDDKRKYITNELSRKRVHLLRAQHDAIITGSGTVIADNPRLTVRDIERSNNENVNPVRIVLDRRARCDVKSNIFNNESKTILITDDYEGKLKDLLKELASMEFLSVMVEAGPVLFNSFVREKCFDEILYFMNTSLLIAPNEHKVYSSENLKDLNLRVHATELIKYEDQEDMLLCLRPEYSQLTEFPRSAGKHVE